MQITREFLEAEIADLEQERRKAHEFCIKSTAAIDTHRMLLARMDAPEPDATPEGHGLTEDQIKFLNE